MISKQLFEDILCKYPELIEPGLKLKGRGMEFYGYAVDILLEDKSRKKLAITVRMAPIKEEHVGDLVSYASTVLTGEDPAMTVMMVSDKVPPHLQKSLEHWGIAWKEINAFRIREHLNKAGDTKMMKAIGD
jgi:RecB family endonuclease NucS